MTRSFPAAATLLALCAAVVAGAGTAAVGVAALAAAHALRGLDNPAAIPSSLLHGAVYLAATAVLLAALPRLIPGGLGALGLRAPGRRGMGAVALGVALVLALRYATYWYLVWLGLPDHVQTGLEHFSVAGPAAAALTIGLAATLAPFAEELFFRGVVYGALAQRYPPGRAALASGLLFAASRGDLILLPFYTAYGTLLAVLYRRTGNLVVPMLVRAVVDGASTAALVWLDLVVR